MSPQVLVVYQLLLAPVGEHFSVQPDGRRWARSSGVLIVTGVYLALVAAAAALVLGAKAVGLLSAEASWWPVPAIVAIGVPIQILTSRFVARRHVRDDVVECAIRSAGSPTGRWRHGRVQKLRGELLFVPGGPAGMRFPQGKATSFPISSMSVDEGRRPALRQAWSINPALHIVRIEAGGQDLELAALAEDLRRLRQMARLERSD